MSLFAINFAIGVATGIIMEFEFGTNWSGYSWMVGDIFGAPLAVEGIFAFFIEATFFAVMFFGWDRVSKRFHLFSTWMVAIGSNLSALWILIANGWMQYPTGMAFNPDKARFEMQNIWDIILSPVAISKFVHATSSSFIVAALFVVGISALFLLQKRHVKMAKRSMAVAAAFGLVASLFVFINGDESAFSVAQRQPMKLAAMEGMYNGTVGRGPDRLRDHQPRQRGRRQGCGRLPGRGQDPRPALSPGHPPARRLRPRDQRPGLRQPGA